MRYPGGKNNAGVFQRIINQMPPHSTYVEPCGGSLAVMYNKLPAKMNIGIDRDGGVIKAARQRFAPLKCGAYEFSFVKGHWHDVIGGWLRKPMDCPETLIYFDPPYMLEARRNQYPIYQFEMTRADHVLILDFIRETKARVIISGYHTRLYDRALKRWRSVEFPAITRGGSLATEVLWFNFPAPIELHDYRHLGQNKAERQALKRKIARWQTRLASMPILERQAMFLAMKSHQDG